MFIKTFYLQTKLTFKFFYIVISGLNSHQFSNQNLLMPSHFLRLKDQLVFLTQNVLSELLKKQDGHKNLEKH